MIDTAVESFENEGDNFRALVIFTDGEDHETGALQAARKAAAKGIRIYALGVGTPAGDQLREQNATDKLDDVLEETAEVTTKVIHKRRLLRLRRKKTIITGIDVAEVDVEDDNGVKKS